MSETPDAKKSGKPISAATGIISTDSKLNNVEGEVKETQGVLLKTIELTLSRGEQINSLEDKSVKMTRHADAFKKNAAAVKWNFCAAYYRNILIAGAILAVIGVVLYLLLKK